MKNIKLITQKISLLASFAAVVLVFTGCNKLLDTQRQGAYDPENYPYPAGSGPYDQFVFGAYNELRAYNLHSQYYICAQFRSDDADKGSSTTDGGANALQFDNFPVLPGNAWVNGLWLGHYSLILAANTGIKEINTNTNIVASEDIKLQSLAEVRFLRAYAYFNLVRFWGNVPLIDTLFSDAAGQNNVPQSTPAQLYQFIENDLTFAAAYLPPSWNSTTFPGRLTSGAANGLLAKVYLTQKKWALAKAATEKVINSGLYDLSVAYKDIFGETGENSKESVFEVQATASALVTQSNGVQYAPIQGVRGANDWNLGWGWNTPSTDLEKTYEPNDPRKDRTFLYLSFRGAGGAPDTLNTTVYGEVTPFWSGNPSSGQLPNRAYNHKVYSSPDYRRRYNNNGGWWMNIRVIRYADVLLMYAEAANELGMTADALDKLELVRARARRNAVAGTLPKITTTDQTALRDIIRHERRVELAMEQDRFFDIVRWGISQQVMQAAGKSAFNASRDNLLPIPQTQIDLSAGVLKQNPNY